MIILKDNEMETSSNSFLIELTENQVLIRDTIRDFAQKKIKPKVMEWDEAQHFPMEIFHELGELGFMGIIFPEEYGGAGRSGVEPGRCRPPCQPHSPRPSSQYAAGESPQHPRALRPGQRILPAVVRP